MSDIIISEINPEPTIYYYIYKTTNLITSAFYVGQHASNTSAFDGYLGSGKILKYNIKKYGKDNYKREILEFCTSADINEKEIYWIAQTSACKSIHPNSNGLNISIGRLGTGCCESNPMYGHRHSPETLLKMTEAQKGKKGLNNQYIYELSNNENYWTFYTTKEHNNINGYFKYYNSDTIVYKGIIINRFKKLDKILKSNVEQKARIAEMNNTNNKFNYVLSNCEDYWFDLTKSERQSITCLFRCNKSDSINWRGVIVTRTPKLDK